MRYLVLATFLASASTPAVAESPCQYRTAGVFEFVNWSFNMTNDKGMEVSLTFRNTLDRPLSWYKIHVELGGHMYGFRAEVPAAAGGEVTAADYLGMPQKDADLFAPLIPALYAIEVIYVKGNHTSYQ